MNVKTNQNKAMFQIQERNRSVLVLALFSSWMLAFLFEGQMFYSLAEQYNFQPGNMMLYGVLANFSGLLMSGILLKSIKIAKQLCLISFLIFIVISLIFFFPPTIVWEICIIVASYLAGLCVGAWAWFLRISTPKMDRVATIADMLILSNVLMIILNMIAIHISANIALMVSMVFLLLAFLLGRQLPEHNTALREESLPDKSIPMARLLIFLCLFIVIITINSGLMYQVVNPAFSHLQWLTSWYWALPYVGALLVMKYLPKHINRSYLLYIAIAMIGLSFISFMTLGRDALSYLVVNTLMLGACGVYDLFWWSILGEMLDMKQNPASVLGLGLSANVLGVFLGSVIGRTAAFSGTDNPNPTLLALVVVCVTLTMLPPLHNYLSKLLKDHVYLAEFSKLTPSAQNQQFDSKLFAILSQRETQVAKLLLQGKTYKTIAGELHISENTVKYYVKNIYSKFMIQSRAELITLLLHNERDNAK